MNDDTNDYLQALRKLNTTLIKGLQLSFFVMENWETMPEEQRKSIVNSLQDLIAKAEEVNVEPQDKRNR